MVGRPSFFGNENGKGLWWKRITHGILICADKRKTDVKVCSNPTTCKFPLDLISANSCTSDYCICLAVHGYVCDRYQSGSPDLGYIFKWSHQRTLACMHICRGDGCLKLQAIPGNPWFPAFHQPYLSWQPTPTPCPTQLPIICDVKWLDLVCCGWKDKLQGALGPWGITLSRLLLVSWGLHKTYWHLPTARVPSKGSFWSQTKNKTTLPQDFWIKEDLREWSKRYLKKFISDQQYW